MHSRTGSIELIINDKENEDMEERFQSIVSTCQIGQKTSMKGCDFIFD